jgi:hypothetical protein
MELRLRIADWKEETYQELPGGQKLNRASVALGDRGDDLVGGFESILFYRADGTSTYVTVMHLTGVLDGRGGSFALTGEGHFDGAAAVGTATIVPGSGTGELAGIGGTATSSSNHADYPFMPLVLDYRLG